MPKPTEPKDMTPPKEPSAAKDGKLPETPKKN
jgi:hypothetical protein